MRRSTMLPAALVAALATAGVADAKSTVTIRGAGWGHGIGMSQYGAMGMAKQGWSYGRILRHYYQGTELGQAPANTVVRVLLQTPSTATISGATNAGTKRLDPAKAYRVSAAGGNRVRVVSSAGRAVGTFAAPLRITNARNAPIKLHGTAGNGVTDGTYRGWFEFRPSGSGVLAVNAIGLEQYVAGVVANESPASWPMAALQAQSIAARSYAITTRKTGENGWEHYADTRSQVYRGAGSEHPNTNRAVNSTAGQVVTYDGDPITTYFFSTSGGRTENVENVWPGATPRPYLRSVEDPYDKESPYHRWSPIVKTRGQMQAALSGLVKGSFRRIEVTKRGQSPRIVRAQIVGTGGRTTVTGSTLQQRFGLRDTWITFNQLITQVEVPPPSKPARQPEPEPERDEDADGAGIENVKGGAAPRARIASWIDRPRVVGELRPGTPGTRVVLQRRDGDTWERAGSTRLGTTHRYKIDLPGPGRYRVKADGAIGPVVRLAG